MPSIRTEGPQDGPLIEALLDRAFGADRLARPFLPPARRRRACTQPLPCRGGRGPHPRHDPPLASGGSARHETRSCSGRLRWIRPKSGAASAGSWSEPRSKRPRRRGTKPSSRWALRPFSAASALRGGAPRDRTSRPRGTPPPACAGTRPRRPQRCEGRCRAAQRRGGFVPDVSPRTKSSSPFRRPRRSRSARRIERTSSTARSSAVLTTTYSYST